MDFSSWYTFRPKKQITPRCSSLVHTESGAAILIVSQRKAKLCDDAETFHKRTQRCYLLACACRKQYRQPTEHYNTCADTYWLALIHFFIVKASCLMDTSYTWMILLYKQLLGRLGSCWIDQVKRHTEESGKGLAQRYKKRLFDGKQEWRIFFSKVTPFVSTAMKTATVMEWAVAVCCVQGREFVQEMFPVKILCFSLKLNITQKHSTVFTWI